MFASFDGEWRVQPYSRVRSRSDPSRFEYKSKLSCAPRPSPLVPARPLPRLYG